MKIILKIFCLLILLNILSFAQQIKISIDNVTENRAILFSLSGEKQTFVDSISALTAGQFSFSNETENRHSILN